MSTLAKNLSSDNIMRKVYDPVTESFKINGTFSATIPPGAATEAKQDAGNASLASIDSKLTNPLPVSGSLTVSPPSVYAVSSLIDTSSTNISNVTYLQLIASTSQPTVKVQIIEDIGEFMALYTGASSSEVLLCALPLGGGEVEVSVPAGTRISIKSLNNTISSGKLIMNLLK